SSNPTRRSLGTYGELTLEQAREKAGTWRNLLRKGVDPQTEEDRQRRAELRRQENSFAAVAEEFIKRHVRKTRKAVAFERELRKEFIERWGARPITEIDQSDVKAVLGEAVDRGAPYQAHNLLVHVRSLFNWAIGQGDYGLGRSPIDRLKSSLVIRQKLGRKRGIDDNELRGLWRVTGKLKYPFGPLFRMLLLTGQRKSEVAEARWREIDLDKKLWTIPPERMKADAAHIVPLTNDVVKVLADLPRFKKGDHLFSTTFGAKPVNGFSKAKARLDGAMAAELGHEPEAFVIHDIRRSVRTNLSALPIPDLV